ncbi:hypothetical protein Tco_1384026 [Tanacetum coccineum]
MITYGLCQRTTGYDKIQKNDLWLLSMFDARHQNGVLTDDVIRSLSALIYCRDLDTLIDSEGKLIPEYPQPGVPIVGIPRPPRASKEPTTHLAMLSRSMTSTISSTSLRHHSISSSRMMMSSVEMAQVGLSRHSEVVKRSEVVKQNEVVKQREVVNVKIGVRGKDVSGISRSANGDLDIVKRTLEFGARGVEYYRMYEKKIMKEVFESSANGHKYKDRIMQGVKWWKNIVLVKSFKEIEDKKILDKKNKGENVGNDYGSSSVMIGMGKEVVRNNKGVIIWAKVVEIVNEVVASNIGKNTMDKAKKISDDLETKGDEEIEFVKRAQVNKSINFIKLNLDPLLDLPFELHTTHGLPLHLMPSLKKAFDLEKPRFS